MPNDKEKEERFGLDFNPELEFGPDGSPIMDETPDDPGIFLPNTEGRTEFLPPDAERIPIMEQAVRQNTEEYAARPAEDRTRELFTQMHPQRVLLLGILQEADEPCSTSKMEEIVAGLHKRKFTVYSPSNFCTMLEIAGALERVNEDGTPYTTENAKPDVVVIEGEEYYEPTDAPEVYWLTTDAGKLMIEENRPLERLKALFDKEEDLLSIYKRVLTMAAEESGTTIRALSNAEDSNPLIAKPTRRFFIQHFTESLENCDAIAYYDGAWHTTFVGMEGLDLLDEVVDDYVAPESSQRSSTDKLPSETEGIRW